MKSHLTSLRLQAKTRKAAQSPADRKERQLRRKQATIELLGFTSISLLWDSNGLLTTFLNCALNDGDGIAFLRRPVCRTSTAALRESIHERSRNDSHSGADNRWQTVFIVDE